MSTTRISSRTVGLGLGVLAFLLFGLAATASAQPEAVTQHVEAQAEERPVEDVTKWELSLGAVLQTGNTRAYQITGGSRFELIRGPHGFLAETAGNYGAAVVDEATDEFDETARNVRLRVRYDFFITDLDAIFASTSIRHDPFAGLDYRFQGQLGYARYVFREENHKLWGEAGYDFTYDNYDPDPLIVDMVELEGSDVVHSARLFAGYDNAINEGLQFRTGIEGLINVEDAEDVRIDWLSNLRSKLVGRLQLEIEFHLQWDNVPVPGNVPLDTTTRLNLVLQLI